ncbi:MAG: MOSC domain-containing protein [Kangiellaceae bacterium]|nr:MOSC domain-containing protein [Kangiellaceae bacterium]
MNLSEIFIYPIKSLAGISLNNSDVKPLGLVNDRCLMLVDENGMFITQRKYPQLALISNTQIGNIVIVKAPNLGALEISETSFAGAKKIVKVWKDECDSFIAEDIVNQWFSDFLNSPVVMVKYDHVRPRATDPGFSQDSDIVSFADGFPLLMISQASLDDLNSKLDDPVSMSNFRPNIVVEGGDAYQEDQWRSVRIGEVEFDLVKQCSRCILTTVDPNTGIKHPAREPLKTLTNYRKTDSGVMFGMNLIPRNIGKIQVGQGVEILR